MVKERKRNPRSDALMLDLVHIIIGILVVVCAVFAFLDPEKNRFLFPVIFALAALLNSVNGWMELKNSGRDKRKRNAGVLQCAAAVLLLAVGIVSAISIWR